MKKSILLFILILSGLSHQTAFAQDTLSQQNPTHVDMLDTPFFNEVRAKLMKEVKQSFHANKDELMEFLRASQNYTEEEYIKLYNNYDANPPFVEKDGLLELNPDYESKNTKLIQQEGKWVKNPNYEEKPNYKSLKSTTTQTLNTISQKRIGKKSFSINPDSFH